MIAHELIESGKKFCFYIPETQNNEAGYIPSVVVEGESGHYPLTGQGEHSQPWYWGKTLKEAMQHARTKNEELGISEEEESKIILSSMFRG